MNKKQSLLIDPLLKSFVPLLVGSSYHLFKEISKNLSFMEANRNFSEKLNDGEVQAHYPMSPDDLFSRFNQISFGIYSNFFAFMLAMLLIDELSKIVQLGVKSFWKEAKSSRLSFSGESFSNSFSTKRRRNIYLMFEKQIMRILSYALIFIFSHLVAGLCCLKFAQSQTFKGESLVAPHMFSGQENDFRISSRILEEQETQDNELVSALSSVPLESDRKISLSMGNVLGSLSLDVNSMILSKSRRIAFATLGVYGTLKVIDVSNLRSPFVIGSLNLELSSYNYQVKNLALSADEKTLFASNFQGLEIIDITDSRSPKLISLTRSEIFNSMGSFGDTKTSLVVEERTKTLYIGGLGLQVYDISDLKKPALLKVVRNDDWRMPKNELWLSHNGQVLFIANGTLDVYNISNPREMKLLTSFKTKSSPRSLLLDEGSQTAFLLGISEGKTIFEEVDISDYSHLSVRKTWNLGYDKSTQRPHFLAISPGKSKFYIQDSQSSDLLIFDRFKKTTLKNKKSLIEDVFALSFSPDGRTLITASNGQFMTIELLLDYPNRQIFSESLDNLISNISFAKYGSNMQISNDQKYLFILRSENEALQNYFPFFEIWDVENTSKPRLLSSYNWNKHISQIYLTKSYETAYLIGENEILVLDIRNRYSPSQKKTYETQAGKNLWSFTASSDEKTGFLIVFNGELGYVTSVDLSPSSPSIIDTSVMLSAKFKGSNSKLVMKDERTLIIFNQGGFLIYDISKLDSPTQLASSPYDVNEPEPAVSYSLLSPDKKTLYIETWDQNGFHKLRVYDVSISTSPQLVGEKYLSKVEEKLSKPGFSLSPDLKSGFIYQSNSLIRLNVTNPKEIKISGIIPLSRGKKNEVTKYLISPDGQTVYASVENQIRIMNMNIQYTLFFKQDKFLLGEKYSGRVSLLNLMGGSSDYNVLDSEAYKITKLSLQDIKMTSNKPALEMTKDPLPSWITFDSESDIVTVDAKKAHDIGTYTFHSAFSLKIPKDIFKDLPVSSKDLWAWLISLGYVDNAYFLTANFGSEDDFLLPEKFENHAGRIYSTLKQFYFETCTGFEIVSSLELEEKKNNSIMVSTLSIENIKVEVNLEPKNGSDVKFVSCPYGSLEPMVKNHNKTKISLEGSLKEINTALGSIVVNFENGTSCDAHLVIYDGFNPTVSVDLANISKYFKANTLPRLNSNSEKTVQEQIDNADIQTGKYFTHTLSNDIFEDDFSEGLNYELKMARNNSAFPTWLSLSGSTLKGTPPQEVFGRDIDLILIAKNEFKQAEVPFTLHIEISLALYLQLVLKFIPYVLTIVGLLVSANKIWNILGKSYYKHFKEFHIRVGQDISTEVIEPISFIKEELDQSQLIWKYMQKANIDLLQQDKEKVLDMIQEAINQMSLKDRQKLTRYPSPLIEKIIMNKFVLMQLDSKGEAQTKALFEKLEPDCMEVVERDPSSSSLEFVINQNKLEELIQRTQIPSFRSANLEESLIGLTSGVNINLLKDVIRAMAFDNHTINILPINLNIEVKQKVPSNFVYKFLKRDLKDIYLNDKNKINYGINYQIIDDKLCFYGVTQNYFKGKTLVVQVKSRHQRILKEIWIHGVSSDVPRNENFMARDEQETRGQGYEIF